jgi:enoyl-CoA hydratase/carnithine racemase
MTTSNHPVVLIQRHSQMMTVILHRPHVLNSLNLEMIRLIHQGLVEARSDKSIKFVLLLGAGERGFCAGGDVKALARAVQANEIIQADRFFQEEYALDLFIHRFPKPVIVLAEGITMGGGLGLAAGADVVVATEHTRMAMPETRIGFFPDVGATGWLFDKCPPGYPEYLALTGYELFGEECVRLGWATHLARAVTLPEIRELLENYPGRLADARGEAAEALRRRLASFFVTSIPTKPEMDEWVHTHFAGKKSPLAIMASLSQCSLQNRFCEDVFLRIAERSPTALFLTLQLLRHNEGRPLEEVFAVEARAAHFMVTHPDYLEGIRARVLDKDDQPHWRPDRLDNVVEIGLKLP